MNGPDIEKYQPDKSIDRWMLKPLYKRKPKTDNTNTDNAEDDDVHMEQEEHEAEMIQEKETESDIDDSDCDFGNDSDGDESGYDSYDEQDFRTNENLIASLSKEL